MVIRRTLRTAVHLTWLTLCMGIVTMPVVQDHQIFAGFGDATNARGRLEQLRGSAATAIRVVRQRVQGLEVGVFARRFINGGFEDSPIFDHPLAVYPTSYILKEPLNACGFSGKIEPNGG